MAFNLNFKFKSDADQACKSMKKVQKELKNTENKMVNITKDSNRASGGINSLSSAFSKLAHSVSATLIGRKLADFVNSSMEAIEVVHLFSIALGDCAEESDAFITSLSNSSGLDLTNLRESTATYALLARSMGMTGEQAQILSRNTTQLALDLSSAMNVPFAQAMQDLRSGLVGQSETMYKYGVDVTEAALKQEALNQGISKSVREMSQGEKMALRYCVMLRQTSIVQTDFARTINQPANQMRILTERIVSCGRSIGNIFMPLLSKVLPYLNALAIVIKRVADAIAKFFGYKPTEVKNTTTGLSSISTGLDDVASGLDNVGSSAGSAADKMKELKNASNGLDELNVISSPDNTPSYGGGGSVSIGGGGGSVFDDITLPDYDSKLNGIKDKAEKLADQIMNALEPLKPFFQGFVDGFKKAYDVTIGPVLKVIKTVLGWVGDWFKEHPDATRALGELAGKLVGVWLAFLLFKKLGDLTGITKLLVALKELLFPTKNLKDAFDDKNKSLETQTQLETENAKELSTNLVPSMASALAVATALSLGLGILNGHLNESGANYLPNLEAGLVGVANGFNTANNSVTEGLLVGITGLEAQLIASTMPTLYGLSENGTLYIKNFSEQSSSEIEALNPSLDGLVNNVTGSVLPALITFNEDGVATITSFTVDSMGQLSLFSTNSAKETKDLVNNKLLPQLSYLEEHSTSHISQLNLNGTEQINAFSNNVKTSVNDAVTNNALPKFSELEKTGSKNMENLESSGKSSFATLHSELLLKAGMIATGVCGSFAEMGTGIGDNIISFGESAQLAFNTFGNSLIEKSCKIATGIRNGFVDGLSKAWTAIKNFATATGEKISGVFNEHKTEIVAGVTLVGTAALTGLAWSSGIFVPAFERGGMLSDGEIFRAGEKGKIEAIGTHKGRTTVMPLENTDFVNAMYKAVRSAMQENNNSNNGTTIVKIGDEVVYRSVEKSKQRNGYKISKNYAGGLV